MSQWPFVIAAYGVTLTAVGGLVGWAWASMRAAEARLEEIADR